MLLDFHTHRKPPYREGIISASPDSFLMPEQFYSLGIHPWDASSADSGALCRLRGRIACESGVVAVGEAGIDHLRGAGRDVQLKLFFRQAEIAAETSLPLIIHDVRAHSEIIAAKKALCAGNMWIIHGFRGGPRTADMLLHAGFMLGFGMRFDREAAAMVPAGAILAETDVSGADIHDVIRAISEARGEDMTEIIAADTSRVFRR